MKVGDGSRKRGREGEREEREEREEKEEKRGLLSGGSAHKVRASSAPPSKGWICLSELFLWDKLAPPEANKHLFQLVQLVQLWMFSFSSIRLVMACICLTW
jgi:hypothetical protein